MHTVNLKGKYIVVAVVVLVLLVGVLAWFNKPAANLANTVTVKQNGMELQVFDVAALQALPAVDAEATITSSKEADESGTFTGVSLQVLLNAVNPTLLSGHDEVIAKAADGYAIAFPAEELLQGENILVVYAKNGAPLAGAEAGGVGPFRILVLDDAFGNRCVKYLNEIEVK